MEVSNVLSPLIRIGDLKSIYESSLPEEFYVFKEEDVDGIVCSDFQKLSQDPSIFAQLQKDCSLDTLSFEGECSTLEEILKIIPNRTGCPKSLKTLHYLERAIGELSCRSSLLNVLQRIPRPFVDISYRNSIEESPEATESRRLVVTQRLVLLSKQNLTTLKDAIKCPQDKVWLGDCSEALDKPELHVCADKLYTSSYFFIEGVFYNDMRNPNSVDLSAAAIEWANSKPELKAQHPFSSASMQSMDLKDLKIHVGKPYFFVHQGNCEHMFIFSDITLVDREACQNPSLFPMLTGRCGIRPLHCFGCKRLTSRWLVSNAKTLLPVDPCPMCDVCIRLLLYTPDGQKVDPNIRVHMYCGEEIVL